MSPVSPIPNLPPIPMPAGVLPAGRDRKRDPDRERAAEDGPEEPRRDQDPPPAPDREPDPGLRPDDPGQIIDIKA